MVDMTQTVDATQLQSRPRAQTIRISEVFGPTIQGEGALVGRPTVFVRTGGCDYRCAWCDTLYAVLPEHRAEWTPLSAEAVLDRVFELSAGQPVLVTLSGGNPALQPLESLLDVGHARGCTFALETQGSAPRAWFAKLDYLVLSPKPPSSGMIADLDEVAACLHAAQSINERTGAANAHASNGPQISLKVVVFDEDDYAFARRVALRFPDVPFYLQPGNHTPDQGQGGGIDIEGITARLEWLIERVGRDGWRDVTILPQLHTLLWGNKRGV